MSLVIEKPMIETKPKSGNEWAILAGLRFLLATVVFALHITQTQRHITPFYYWSQLGGLTAVLCFFVVSGFSIAASIEKQPTGFYIRRIRRVYPVYLACFALALISMYLSGSDYQGMRHIRVHEPFSAKQIIGNALMLQGLAVQRLNNFGPSWSLSIECVFYLFAPLFARLNNKWISVLITLSALVYFCSPHYLDIDVGIRVTVALAWAWLSGFLYYRVRSKIAGYALLFLGLFLLTWANEQGGTCSLLLYTFCWILMMYGLGLRLTPRIAKTINYLGELSYPLYLVHYPIFTLIFIAFHWVPVTVAVPLCLASSILLYHFVDKPFRHARRVTTSQRPIPMNRLS